MSKKCVKSKSKSLSKNCKLKYMLRIAQNCNVRLEHQRRITILGVGSDRKEIMDKIQTLAILVPRNRIKKIEVVRKSKQDKNRNIGSKKLEN